MEKTCGKCGDDTPACNFLWARNQELEQRYAQLEKVAREMWRWVDGVTNRCWTVIPEQPGCFRDQLEALGVSLDEV